MRNTLSIVRIIKKEKASCNDKTFFEMYESYEKKTKINELSYSTTYLNLKKYLCNLVSIKFEDLGVEDSIIYIGWMV